MRQVPLRPLRVGVAAVLAAATIAVLSGAAASTAAPRAPRCEPGDIEIVAGPAGYGLGHWAIRLLILDPGGRTCTFRGYPTVKAYTSPTKTWVTALPEPSGYMGGLGMGVSAPTVRINGYMVASSTIEGTDVPVNGATTCPTYVRITVALPGWPPSANLSIKNFACSRLEVHPIVYGPTGNRPPVL